MAANAVANNTHLDGTAPLHLKRLTIVNTAAFYGAATVSVTSHIYQSAKDTLLPTFVKTKVQGVEDVVTQTLAPVIAWTQDSTHLLLHLADDEVDRFLNQVDSTVAQTLDQVGTVKEKAINAKDTGARVVVVYAKAYLAAVLAASKEVAEKLHSVSGVQTAQIKLQQAIAKAQECTDPDVAIETASDAWAHFAAFPPVATLLSLTKPLSTRSLSVFKWFHDTLVASPYYAFAVDFSGKVLATTTSIVSGTFPYRLGAKYVYPKVEPVVNKISQSKTVTKTVSYWKPIVM